MAADTDTAEIRRWHAVTGHAHVSLLRWYRTVGYARHGGVGVEMFEPCAVPGDDIEYLPGTALRIDGRDMTDDESQSIRRLLEQMASDAIDALSGQSTLAVVIQK